METSGNKNPEIVNKVPASGNTKRHFHGYNENVPDGNEGRRACSAETGEQAREYLELLMSTEYPDIQPDKWGIYILKDTPGTGVEWTPEAVYSKLRSTVRSIDGTVLTSTEADIAINNLCFIKYTIKYVNCQINASSEL